MPKNLIYCLLLLFAAVGCSKPAVGGSGIGIGGNYLQVDIVADRDCVKAGEVVKLRAVATNRGKTTAVISLQDRPVLDIRIAYRSRSDLRKPDMIEQWSDGRELTAEDKRLELAPGASKSIALDWVAQKAAGRFGQIDLEASLRYGERDSDVTIGHTLLSVETCP